MTTEMWLLKGFLDTECTENVLSNFTFFYNVFQYKAFFFNILSEYTWRKVLTLSSIDTHFDGPTTDSF